MLHHIESIQNGVDGTPQGTGTLAMDKAHLGDSTVATFFEIVRNQGADVGGTEGMQVEGAIDREFDRFRRAIIVHADIPAR
jgi:hypothetical protein